MDHIVFHPELIVFLNSDEILALLQQMFSFSALFLIIINICLDIVPKTLQFNAVFHNYDMDMSEYCSENTSVPDSHFLCFP